MFEGLRGMLALPEDPNERAAAKQGLLALGGAMMSSRGQNFLGTVGEGLGAGAQGYQGALDQQQQNQYRQAQTQQAQMEAQKTQAQLARPGRISDIFKGVQRPGSPSPGQVGSGAGQPVVTPLANVPRLGQQSAAPQQPSMTTLPSAMPPAQMEAYYRDLAHGYAAAGEMDLADKFMGYAENQKRKLMKQEARTVGGQRVMANVFEDGVTEQVDGFAPDAEKLVFADNGGTYNGRDAYTGEVKSTSQNSVAPNTAAQIAQQERERRSSDERSRTAISQGKTPVGYRWTPDGQSLEAIPGGPVTAKTTEVQQKVSDAQSVLGLLDMAEPLVNSATSSYGGAAIDQVARTFGMSTDGGQSAAQLKAIEGALISKMPKMSGPQSDKDVLLYRQMAGQIGDPTIPAANKIAAMKVIREINERYLNQVQPQRVKTREELPKKATAPSGAPAAGTVKGGYRFKGGNPAVQSNWEKV